MIYKDWSQQNRDQNLNSKSLYVLDSVDRRYVIRIEPANGDVHLR